ncbi:MAG: two-component regulator propeller domain-containing protein [Candidatus Aminicenantes bacterium]|jgi:ligand-binding sensor domain-containing protein
MRWNKVISKWNSLFLFSVLFLIFSAQLLVSKNENVRFDHIGVNEERSQNTVFCIFQDSKGFMWFGLWGGLNRYDGRGFIIYNDSNTKVENGTFGYVINAIDEDKNGKIWIGTDRGLLKFGPTMEKFYGIADWQYDKDVRAICVDEKGSLWAEADTKVIEVDPQRKICIGQSIEVEHEVRDICCGYNGELWIGTENGLFRMGSEKKISGVYLEGESISKIYKDSAKTVWVGTEDGKLFRYKGNKEFEFFDETDHEIGLNAICEDDENNLWLGLNGDGIIIYSKKVKTDRKPIKKNVYFPGGLKDNFVQCIIKDKAGTMWIGTHSGGINKYNPNKFKFKSYFNDPRDINSLSGRSIFSIFEDSQGFIWIGTYDGELDRFDPREEKFKSFDKGIFKGESILSINEDTNGWLWIGTSEDLYRLDKKNRKNEKFEPIKDRDLGRNIRIIVKDQYNHHFWIGTNEKGIVKFDPREEKFIDAFSEDNGLSDNNIYSIFPDTKDDNILWVGTAKGLDKVNKSSGDVTPVIFKDKKIEVIHSFLPFFLKEMIPAKNKERRIFYILPDPDPQKKDIFWLGTDNSGLCKFNKKTKEITSFTTRNDLPNNTVYGIFKDEQGYLWFSTNKGIVQFDPKEEKVKRKFDVDDGLQENEFNHGAYCKSHSGHMYFGGVRGLSMFDPSEIEEKVDEKTLPPIYFTKLRIGNKEVKVGYDEVLEDIILQKSITETPILELDYKHQPFTLEFAALDYNVPGRIEYKCELWKDGKLIENNDGRWISNDFYTFSNLNSGKYTVKVWCTNSDLTNIVDTNIDKYFKNQTPAEIEIIIKKQLLDRLKPIIIPLLIIAGISILLIANFYIVFRSRTKRYINKLKMIEEAINDVPQLESIKDVISRVLGYIVYSFGFDRYRSDKLTHFCSDKLIHLWFSSYV